MARIVVTTLGSLGDLHPMFPIADLLRRRGHSVLFVVPSKLQARVINQGFENHAVRMMPDPPEDARTRDFSAAAAKARIERHYTPFLRGAIEVLDEACIGADVILSTPHQIATAVVGTQRGIPWVTLTVFPGLIPSAYSVPQPHWLPALPTPAGRWVNRLTWSVYGYGIRYLGEGAIATAVASLGIPANKLFAPGGLSPHLCLVMSSPVYSPPQPDWPPQVKITGFTLWDEPAGWREPPELTQFLSDGPAPIVVTTSTAEERDTVGYARVAMRAIEATGRRGIILTGASTDRILGTQTHLILDSGVAAWPYIPLSRLLPHASMVVHHSGIGTAVTTIRHGLGAVAIPASFDQWYNAARVRALGVGRTIKFNDLTVERLAKAIGGVANDPSYGERARALAAAMAGEDGVGRACDEIEALVGKPQAASA
ncbi:MAG: glycosyltransferase [Candidatus Dormiibacterota bacterium]